MTGLHDPVLVGPVLEYLLTRPDGTYLDGTTGTGGHAEAILGVLGERGRLIGLDQDPDALEVARRRLEGQLDRVHLHRGSFSELDAVLRAEGLDAFDGILLDLGLNSWSLAQTAKGLSYQVDAPLRMDLDPDLRRTAADVVNQCSENELARIFDEFGGLRRAWAYARRVVSARERQPLHTTGDLVRAVSGRRALPPAELSRLFQSLRVEVCRETERLEQFLERAAGWIRPGGRLLIISYASHEDRRVKGLARGGEGTPGAFVPLLRSPIRPGRDEVARNRRARSARLRVFERGGQHETRAGVGEQELERGRRTSPGPRTRAAETAHLQPHWRDLPVRDYPGGLEH